VRPIKLAVIRPSRIVTRAHSERHSFQLPAKDHSVEGKSKKPPKIPERFPTRLLCNRYSIVKKERRHKFMKVKSTLKAGGGGKWSG
jgi:hypothetical protein